MKAFRFRLDPVMRIKRYEIQEKEREIQRLESEIQSLLHEIDDGRDGVETLRRRLMDECSDDEFRQIQETLNMYRAYMTKVEREKRAQIGRLRQEQSERRQELIGLYQEEKIFENLREKKQKDWRKETQHEENKTMDEIGTQKYIQRRREHGGVLLYLLVPVLLAGAAAGVGWYTGVIDREMIAQLPIPFLQQSPRSATPEVQQATSIAVADAYTTKDLLGDLDTPMPDLLNRIMQEREELRRLKVTLDDREAELDRRENLLSDLQGDLSGYVESASDQLETLQDLERRREQAEKSELSELEEKVATAMSLNKPKEISGLFIQLYQAATVAEPDERREQQLRTIRILRRMPEKAFSEMMAQLQKENPMVAAQMLNDYMSLNTEELYGLTPADPPPNEEDATMTDMPGPAGG